MWKVSKLFRFYGELCASHPWEVIVTITTSIACLFAIENAPGKNIPLPSTTTSPIWFNDDSIPSHHNADTIFMALIRCSSLLYTYRQLKNLQSFNSKYIFALAGLFVVIASIIFTLSLYQFQNNAIHFNDALFFFLLSTDLSKVADLAQFALKANDKNDIQLLIGKGIEHLGPQLTLDTIVETLVIGVGTLSGVKRLESLSYIACLSTIVNYIVLMTFYPACLSLAMELARISTEKSCRLRNRRKSQSDLNDNGTDINLVVQRVKLIMSIGLLVVHLHSRLWWTITTTTSTNTASTTPSSESSQTLTSDHLDNEDNIVNSWIKAEHITIMFVLLFVIVMKLVFFQWKQPEPTTTTTTTTTTSTIITSQQSQLQINQVNNDNNDEVMISSDDDDDDGDKQETIRSVQECLRILRDENNSSSKLLFNQLSNNEFIQLIETKHLSLYELEKLIDNNTNNSNNFNRVVKIRRKFIEKQLYCDSKKIFKIIPYKYYDYSKVLGVCCENVIGYVPVPLGLAGPLLLDDEEYYIPMATTEGCLVASTNRGCRALEKTGVKSRVVSDGMTRAPVVRFASITKLDAALSWIKIAENFQKIKVCFDSTSRFAKLSKLTTHIAGRYLFIRFVAETGDAMGMNMVSKGTEKALKLIQDNFPDMEILSLSGNVCSDKKSAAMNWIEGRGKSVVCEAIVPAEIVRKVLKTTTRALVDLNISKNFVGSAVASTIGGFNAHAANIVTAIYIATGQDVAQTVTSSNCLTLMEPYGGDSTISTSSGPSSSINEMDEDLLVSCTMPSLEIGTVGGGTVLSAQSGCLEMLGVKGPHAESPGHNAKQFARIICGAVLAGELSLMAALASGSLVKSHLRYNRSFVTTKQDSDKKCC